jgi:phytoene dehydrogenase-like protein
MAGDEQRGELVPQLRVAHRLGADEHREHVGALGQLRITAGAVDLVEQQRVGDVAVSAQPVPRPERPQLRQQQPEQLHAVDLHQRWQRTAQLRQPRLVVHADDRPQDAATARLVASYHIAVCDGLIVQWLLDPSRAPQGRELVDALSSALTVALPSEGPDGGAAGP